MTLSAFGLNRNAALTAVSAAGLPTARLSAMMTQAPLNTFALTSWRTPGVTMSVIDLSARRAPVTYTITVTHHWDGSMELFVEGIAESGRGNLAVAEALLHAAEIAERNGPKD